MLILLLLSGNLSSVGFNWKCPLRPKPCYCVHCSHTHTVIAMQGCFSVRKMHSQRAGEQGRMKSPMKSRRQVHVRQLFWILVMSGKNMYTWTKPHCVVNSRCFHFKGIFSSKPLWQLSVKSQVIKTIFSFTSRHVHTELSMQQKLHVGCQIRSDGGQPLTQEERQIPS